MLASWPPQQLPYMGLMCKATSRSIGKICLKCQIGNLKIEVTAMLLMQTPLTTFCWDDYGFTLTLLLFLLFIGVCLKYEDKQGIVKTVFAEEQPFKGVENYFIDSNLYRDGQEDKLMLTMKQIRNQMIAWKGAHGIRTLCN